MREGSNGVYFDFSQRDSESIEGLKSATSAKKAIACVSRRSDGLLQERNTSKEEQFSEFYFGQV